MQKGLYKWSYAFGCEYLLATGMMASYILFTVVWPAKCIQDDSCPLLNMLKHHHYSRTIWNLQTYLPYQCTQCVPTQLVGTQHIPHAHLLVWYTQSILLAPPLHYFLMYVTHTSLVLDCASSKTIHTTDFDHFAHTACIITQGALVPS